MLLKCPHCGQEIHLTDEELRKLWAARNRKIMTPKALAARRANMQKALGVYMENARKRREAQEN